MRDKTLALAIICNALCLLSPIMAVGLFRLRGALIYNALGVHFLPAHPRLNPDSSRTMLGISITRRYLGYTEIRRDSVFIKYKGINVIHANFCN